ncbi:Condensin complex subunit 3 [Phytophthora palmivora]|uniref:Condensin complex subunit 3 n=1 Tax=Phytophthora palmivora TaxID=4796 RepID=A0A2P4XM54_9STRA|nr:Condensin complex subunit 3 [Phytophthora palmivora]
MFAILSDSSDSSDSESDEVSDKEPAGASARYELLSRRSKNAAVSRMHEKDGEFETKIKQALQADSGDEESEI